MTYESKPMPIIGVLWLVRDARSTKGSQRELLYALALRTNPAKKFLCFPSYAQLAEDTQLDSATLKRAAKALEDKQLIKRVIRRNRSNVYFLNIPLLQEQAALAKAAKISKAESTETPFGDPVESSVLDGNDRPDNNDDLTYAVTGGTR
jgi:DNA-binding MarR family transcriptional regulator